MIFLSKINAPFLRFDFIISSNDVDAGDAAAAAGFPVDTFATSATASIAEGAGAFVSDILSEGYRDFKENGISFIMGIPSYFRNILRSYPGCLIKKVSADILCFDFNCLIYRCIKTQPADSSDIDIWEDGLIQEIKKTVLEVWREAGKPKKVFIAVDGVVPMAKIRQQRVRRFKSAWLRASKGSSDSWDTNAITPGSRFMEKLDIVLKGIDSRWLVSGFSEEGEGEHKIMKWLRSFPEGGSVIVYGLDADLILLTMLVGEETGRQLYLMREKQEFGNKETSNEYQFMDIREFQKRLGLVGENEVINYIALMSLMGNDFLPHSLTHKLSENGHEFVTDEMTLLKSDKWLVESGELDFNVLRQIFQRWSQNEEEFFLHTIRKKEEQAKRGQVPKGMDESEGLPLKWAVEGSLTHEGKLKDSWRDEYWKFIHPLIKPQDMNRICHEYIKGFSWILDYYRGRQVNRSWMFPAWIPPLWSDLAKFTGELLKDTSPGITPLPQEQLAMVLPLESWGLIRDPRLRRLPHLAPQMWPRKFGFISLGRKWLWECEALIPVLTASRLRDILKEEI